MFVFGLSSVLICCYRKRREEQVIQKKSDSKDMSSANSASEDQLFTITASTTLDSSCAFDTTFLQHPNNDKCLYV